MRGEENKTLKYCGPPFVHTSSALSLYSAPLGELGHSGGTRSGLFSGRSVSTVGGNFCERGGNGRRGSWKMARSFFQIGPNQVKPDFRCCRRFYSPSADRPLICLRKCSGFGKTEQRKILRETLISQLPPQSQQHHSAFP